ncbi:gp72 [Synechococcus phage syn9]|uniref:Gp72 n=1 Tax=Synechococcus phage syn9 TaxID=382359 RepID=Q0QZF6_BPSYS|nr:gp72 [Synechococcus phage syn9]ABA47041.1 gp72 [Synechococcus phage syn9]AGH56595.1 hypothetical protein CPUG_00103 [Cyanophage Syn10]
MTKTTSTTNENKQKTVVIPEGAELVDDVFYVWETRFGLYSTMTKDGRNMLTGGTKDGVIIMTRWHLKCEQDGSLDDHSRVVNSGVVEGKL